MKFISYVIVLVTVLTFAGCKKETPVLKDSTHPVFKVGQRWHYAARPQEPNSTVIILKIETDPNGIYIIHIAVEDVVISRSDVNKPSTRIGHLPVSDDVLESSVTSIVEESVTLPDFQQGYQLWREAFDKGESGVFSLPVSECVESTEKALNTGIKKKM
jgi:hypothetical protein